MNTKSIRLQGLSAAVCCLALVLGAGAAWADDRQILDVDDIMDRSHYVSVGNAGSADLYGMTLGAVKSRGVVEDYIQHYIRNTHDEKGAGHHQVVMEVAYVGSRRFYRRAQLEGDQALPFGTLERRMSRCTSAFLKCDHRERVMAEVTRQQLEQALEKGLYVNFESKLRGRDTAVYFPPVYIEAYLTQLDGRGAVRPSALALAGR